MSAANLRFQVDSRLATLLSQEYRSTERALKELVDNAWDADADQVSIQLPKPMSGEPIAVMAPPPAAAPVASVTPEASPVTEPVNVPAPTPTETKPVAAKTQPLVLHVKSDAAKRAGGLLVE